MSYQITMIQKVETPHDLLVENLESNGHHVEILTEESEATRSLATKTPSAILYSIQGRGARRELAWIKCFRQSTKCPIIVALKDQPESMKDFYGAGAEIVFVGPISYHLLEDILEEALLLHGDYLVRHLRPAISHRVSTDVPVEIQHSNLTPVGKTRNLSQTGMFVEHSKDNLPEAQELKFSLFLPEERRNEGSRDGICLIEAKAKIRHKKSGGFGAEFTDLSDQAEEKLARFINTYRTQP